jgi:alkylation response protein AidB-like acyl-CoA dehydrogenase
MMTEIISRADASLQNLFGLQSIAQTIQKFGSEEQKQEYLPKFASGEYDGAMALTEPDHGSDLQAVETSATQDPDNPNIWRLNGVKHFITNGSAKVLLVLARSEAGTRDGRGLSMFIAKAGPQIKIHRIERKLGIHGSPTCELHFENAPAELVGQRRFGLIKYVMSLMNGARLAICSQAVGLAEAARRKAWDWTTKREQFGKRLCDIPPVRDMLERMDSQVLAGRALLYETSKCVDLRDGYEAKSLACRDDADAKEKTKVYTKLAALLTPMAKFFTTEMANAVAYDAIQCHGGKGYMFEHEVERLYRDARIMNIYEGTTQLQIVAATGGVMTHVLDSTLDELEKVEHADEKLKALAAKVKAARTLTDEAIALVDAEMKDKTELVARRLVRMQAIVYTSLLMLREVECDKGRMAATVRYVNEMVPEVAMNMEIIKSLKD